MDIECDSCGLVQPVEPGGELDGTKCAACGKRVEVLLLTLPTRNTAPMMTVAPVRRAAPPPIPEAAMPVMIAPVKRGKRAWMVRSISSAQWTVERRSPVASDAADGGWRELDALADLTELFAKVERSETSFMGVPPMPRALESPSLTPPPVLEKPARPFRPLAEEDDDAPALLIITAEPEPEPAEPELEPEPLLLELPSAALPVPLMPEPALLGPVVADAIDPPFTEASGPMLVIVPDDALPVEPLPWSDASARSRTRATVLVVVGLTTLILVGGAWFNARRANSPLPVVVMARPVEEHAFAPPDDAATLGVLTNVLAEASPPDLGAPALADAATPPQASPDLGSAVDAGVPGPTYAELIALARRRADRGSNREAIELYQRALALNPRSVAALDGLGFCLIDTDKYAAAAARFEQALRVSRHDGDALIGLAETYRLRNNDARALHYYKRYLAEVPNGTERSMAETHVKAMEARSAPPPPEE